MIVMDSKVTNYVGYIILMVPQADKGGGVGKERYKGKCNDLWM